MLSCSTWYTIHTPETQGGGFCGCHEMDPLLYLLYLSASFLWWQAVVGIMGVKSRNAWRMHSRRMWRPRVGSRNVHHTAIRRVLSPSHPCGRGTGGVHG